MFWKYQSLVGSLNLKARVYKKYLEVLGEGCGAANAIHENSALAIEDGETELRTRHNPSKILHPYR